MSDKVQDLVDKLYIATTGHAGNVSREFERILHAELKPLLDTAKIFYDARPYSIRHSDEGTALADELERWGRAKP